MSQLSAVKVTRVLMNMERVVTVYQTFISIQEATESGVRDASTLPYQKYVIRAAYKLAYLVSLLGTGDGPSEELKAAYSTIAYYQVMPSDGDEDTDLAARVAEESQRDQRILDTFATVVTDMAKKLSPDGRLGLSGLIKAVDGLYPETLELLDELKPI